MIEQAPPEVQPRHWSRWLPISAVVLVFLVAVTSAIWIRSPLGHDEAVYGLRARDLMSGAWSVTSGGYWADYRAPGLSVMMAAVGKVIGLHVSSSRAIVMVLGAVIVVSVWALARVVGGEVAGIAAALVLPISTGFSLTSSLLLADVPGAALSIVAVVVYDAELRRGRLRWSFALVPLLAFGATVSRFGAPFMLGAGLVAVSIAVVADVWRRRDWVLVAQVAVLAIAVALSCAVVLFTELLSLGTLSPVEANERLIGGKGLDAATGWRDLRRVVNPWSSYPLHLWGRATFLVVVAGVVLSVIGAIRRRIPPLPLIGFLVAAIASTIAIVVTVGLVVPNYLALTLPYWAVVVGQGYGWLVRAVWPRIEGIALLRDAVLVAVAIGTSMLVLGATRATRTTHDGYIHSFGNIRAASIAAGDDLGDGCLLITSYTPQVGYYSECTVMTFNSSRLDMPLEEMLPQRISAALGVDAASLGEVPGFDGDDSTTSSRVPLPSSDQLAVLVVESGKRQPLDAVFDTSPALDRERLFEFGAAGERRRHAWVQMIDPCVLEATCVTATGP